MKKTFLTLLVALVCMSASAMSISKIRQNARFLSDRMAYELDLTVQQYDDVYEINYDFLYAISPYLDDMVMGYSDVINTYYTYLDYRNSDLRYVLSLTQYYKFIADDYFYRPIYSTGSTWNLRIYTIYSNRNFFYYDKPSGYKTYNGMNAYRHRSNANYYANRYTNVGHYTGETAIHGSNLYNQHQRNDFGNNVHERNQPQYNNYKNSSASNRTQDSRYRDNSGNQNSPYINNRSQQNNGQSSHSNNGQNSQQTNNNNNQNKGNQQQSSNRPTTQTQSTSHNGQSTTSQKQTGTSSKTSATPQNGGLRGNTNGTQQDTQRTTTQPQNQQNSNRSTTTTTTRGSQTTTSSGTRRATTTTSTSGRGGR